jgi:hypothetical protein
MLSNPEEKPWKSIGNNSREWEVIVRRYGTSCCFRLRSWNLKLTHIKRKDGRHVNWAKERLDEMEAVLTSLESKVAEVQGDARDKAKKALADLGKSRDIFRDTIKKQAEANEAAWTSAKEKLEPQWSSFETEVRKYVETFSRQFEQQRATFKLQSAAQLKAWREAADKLAGDTNQFAAERQAEIDTAVKRMQTDAAAAEVKLQKQMEQMGTQSWSALMAVLTETRAAFDRANQAARDAFKRVA